MAREMRKNPTKAEAFMWKRVRKKRIGGFKILRQHIIKDWTFNDMEHFYIVDFYNSEKKLIIELDGRIHLKRKMYDRNREYVLRDLGYSIIRFKNEEILNYWQDVEHRLLTELRYS